MQKIDSVLPDYSKKFKITTKKARPINLRYESAVRIEERLNLPRIFVMRLFKLYGYQNTLDLEAYFGDHIGFRSSPKDYRIAYAVDYLKRKKAAQDARETHSNKNP